MKIEPLLGALIGFSPTSAFFAAGERQSAAMDGFFRARAIAAAAAAGHEDRRCEDGQCRGRARHSSGKGRAKARPNARAVGAWHRDRSLFLDQGLTSTPDYLVIIPDARSSVQALVVGSSGERAGTFRKMRCVRAGARRSRRPQVEPGLGMLPGPGPAECASPISPRRCRPRRTRSRGRRSCFRPRS